MLPPLSLLTLLALLSLLAQWHIINAYIRCYNWFFSYSNMAILLFQHLGFSATSGEGDYWVIPLLDCFDY